MTPAPIGSFSGLRSRNLEPGGESCDCCDSELLLSFVSSSFCESISILSSLCMALSVSIRWIPLSSHAGRMARDIAAGIAAVHVPARADVAPILKIGRVEPKACDGREGVAVS